MSAHALGENEAVTLAQAQDTPRTSSRELLGETLAGGTFLLAAVAIAALAGVPAHPSLSVAALYVLGIAITAEIRFDVGAGFTAPTQVVFVPMLFAVPLALVPLLVALGLQLATLPSALAGRTVVRRLLLVPGNSWFALGPTAVLLLAHVHAPDERPLVLMLAFVAQLGCDFVASAVRERLAGGADWLVELLRELPEVYAIDLALSTLGLLAALAAAAAHSYWVVLLVAPLFLMLRYFSRERQARLAQLVELNDAYQGTALLLGDVVEADDTYTGSHCKGVVALALAVARELRLERSVQRHVEFGALLHDVGKIAVPKEIINKRGPLDEREWAVIRMHTIEGQRMLERIGGMMREVGRIVRSSHERWDGGGYPDGLAGEAIPLEARIVSACDAFNAMTTTRSYRKAMALDAAVAELRAGAGSQFDPAVVAALLCVVESDTHLLSGARAR